MGNEGAVRGGLGLIPGEIVHLRDFGCHLRIPHMGWNEAKIVKEDPLFDGIPSQTDFYFVHSFGFKAADQSDVLATMDYGADITAVVRKGNVWGTQFHPEKSSKQGLRLLANFVEHS